MCVLTGLAGVYYAFFSCFLLLAAGAAAAVRERRWATLAASVLPVLLIAGALAAALSPSLLHTAQYGRNLETAQRSPAEADIYGLRVSDMLLPVVQHRIGFLAHLSDRFLAPPRQPTGEAAASSLGALASLGFLWLCGRFLWRRRGAAQRTDDGLAYLTVISVALGTVGGLGCLFAFYVSPMIRCYNRLSIFIAFFALAGLFLGIQRLAARFVKGPWSRGGLRRRPGRPLAARSLRPDVAPLHSGLSGEPAGVRLRRGLRPPHGGRAPRRVDGLPVALCPLSGKPAG